MVSRLDKPKISMVSSEGTGLVARGKHLKVDLKRMSLLNCHSRAPYLKVREEYMLCSFIQTFTYCPKTAYEM
ncbi:hypothetical protein TNCV_3085741 [Trichonephila clavipes]|nr:hypothetical protein TNCV_3085741 [Trichonephila clavipes]